MISCGDNEFTRFINKGNLLNHVDSEHSTFSFMSQINTFDEALQHFARIFKTPLNMRESMSQVRDSLSWKFELYYIEKFLSSLGNFKHPSRAFPYVTTNLKNVDDDTLYQRIEEFKSHHYSAHRMSLCLQTHLSLDEMQV